MLASISRLGGRKWLMSSAQPKWLPSPARRVLNCKSPKPMVRVWRASYITGNSEAFKAAEATKEGFKDPALEVDSIADTLSSQGVTADHALRLSRQYWEQTGKPLVAPPSVSTEASTIKLNSVLKRHFEAFEYSAMRAQWLIAMREKVVPDCESYMWMIESIVAAKTPKLIEPLEEMMVGLRMEKTLPLLNAILHYSAENLDSTRASAAFKELLTTGLKPDIRSVDYYMQSHARPETFTVVVEAFTKYPEKWKLTVDSDMQGSFIKALLMIGKEEMAIKRYEAMTEGKALPFPSNKTINLMMAHYFSKQQYDKVQELFDSIHGKFGLYPDKDSYATLMEMKMAQGLHDEVRQIVLRLCGDLWPISSNTLLQLMQHYHNQRQFDWVEKLWALLPKAKVTPTLDHLNIVFSSSLDQNKPDRALAYMVIAKQKYGVALNRTLYAALISRFGAMHDLSKSLILYRKMALDDKILPGPTTMFALLFAYVQSREYESAARLLRNPETHGVPRINRHLFETAIEALDNYSEDPLQSLFEFDWTRLEGITSESLQELKTLTASLHAVRNIPYSQ